MSNRGNEHRDYKRLEANYRLYAERYHATGDDVWRRRWNRCYYLLKQGESKQRTRMMRERSA